MNADFKLEKLINENYEVTTELLWSKVCSFHRDLIDITNLTTDEKNITIILRYLKNINKTEPNYRQFITAKNDSIDVVLRRYMLEAATLYITVDFDIDPLGYLPADSTIEIIQMLEECFSKAFNYKYKAKLHLFLNIKNEHDSIHISIDRSANERIFDKKIKL